jgi:choline dehydrogenase
MPARVDYAIIGAGTAGCVLAARLSQDPSVRVALLELGGAAPASLMEGEDAASLFRTWEPGFVDDWEYRTTQQQGLNGRAIHVRRGKVLGGCSAINAMLYVRGNCLDFAEWQQLGAEGWSYSELLALFKKSGCYLGPDSEYHGRNGPVTVLDYGNASPVSHAFVEAAVDLGCREKYVDFNGACQDAGAGFYQSTRTSSGARVSAASAFVTPNLRRSNLSLLLHVRATRVLVEQGRAVGVEYSSGKRLDELRVAREVVLCAGAFESPKLMLLSGLGPAKELTRKGLAVVHDLPGVGQNLHDHLMFGVGFESKIPLHAPELVVEAGLFTRSPSASRSLPPDLQHLFGPLQFIQPEYRTSAPGFTFAPILLRPQSRGSLRLASTEPTAPAHVDMRYLSTESDVAILEHGLRYARELAHTKPFAALRGRELAPGNRLQSKAELRAYIRKTATTVWHACGTCKMGKDRLAVVNERLEVYGIEGLRIADASIMPRLVSGNPNAAVMMIAEKAAELMGQG